MKTDGLSVLIIDDSRIIRERLEEQLRELEGLQCIVNASSAGEGLEKAEFHKPALVILDLKLPDRNGIEILVKITEIDPPPVVIVLTNYPYPSYRKRCIELGADYFLDKSSDFPEVKEIIMKLINGYPRTCKMNSNVMNTKTVKILLAEDDEINRDMLSRRLIRKGYEVVMAVDGIEALEKVYSENPDLILMDLSLPGMDGWEATRRLKQDNRTSHIPIIALTAHALKSDRENAIEAGCDDFDIKPVEFSRLIAKIENQLNPVFTH